MRRFIPPQVPRHFSTSSKRSKRPVISTMTSGWKGGQAWHYETRNVLNHHLSFKLYHSLSSKRPHLFFSFLVPPLFFPMFFFGGTFASFQAPSCRVRRLQKGAKSLNNLHGRKKTQEIFILSWNTGEGKTGKSGKFPRKPVVFEECCFSDVSLWWVSNTKAFCSMFFLLKAEGDREREQQQKWRGFPVRKCWLKWNGGGSDDFASFLFSPFD